MTAPARVPARSTSTGLRAPQTKRYAALPCRSMRRRAAGGSGRTIIRAPRRRAVAGTARGQRQPGAERFGHLRGGRERRPTVCALVDGGDDGAAGPRRPRLAAVRRDRQHRSAEPAQDRFGGGAEEQFRGAATAVRAHDDDAGAHATRVREHDRARRTDLHDAADVRPPAPSDTGRARTSRDPSSAVRSSRRLS